MRRDTMLSATTGILTSCVHEPTIVIARRGDRQDHCICGTVLLATQRWTDTSWYKKLPQLRRNRRHSNQTLYLGKKGSLQKRPQLATVFTYIAGRDAYNVAELPNSRDKTPIAVAQLTPSRPPCEIGVVGLRKLRGCRTHQLDSIEIMTSHLVQSAHR